MNNNNEAKKKGEFQGASSSTVSPTAAITRTSLISPAVLLPNTTETPPESMVSDMVQGLAAAAAARKEASLQLSSLKLQVAKMEEEKRALLHTQNDLQAQLHAAQATIADLYQQLASIKSSTTANDDTHDDNEQIVHQKEREMFSIKAIHSGGSPTKITVLADQEKEEEQKEKKKGKEEERMDINLGKHKKKNAAATTEDDDHGMKIFVTSAIKVGKGAALTIGLALVFALLRKKRVFGKEKNKEKGKHGDGVHKDKSKGLALEVVEA
jgi:hypothetical protein